MKLKLTRKRVAAGATALAVVAGGTLFATAIAGAQTSGDSTASYYVACVAPGNKLANDQLFPSASKPDCGENAVRYVFASKKSLDDAKADLQEQIDALAPVSGSGTTHVIHWDENGTPSWAVDDFTRAVTLRQQSAVDAAKCGSQATSCYFYTGTLADNGTFVANDGAPTPANNDGAAAIDGVVDGTMTGVAQVELYADKAPTAQLPLIRDGRGTGPLSSTTTFAQGLFPAGTHVGSIILSGYSWTYKSTCETWTENYVAASGGPEVQSGNITGACPSPPPTTTAAN